MTAGPSYLQPAYDCWDFLQLSLELCFRGTFKLSYTELITHTCFGGTTFDSFATVI
jgi:hypothetical protein